MIGLFIPSIGVLCLTLYLQVNFSMLFMQLNASLVGISLAWLPLG